MLYISSALNDPVTIFRIPVRAFFGTKKLLHHRKTRYGWNSFIGFFDGVLS
jgi:hypothetical protein